MESSEITNQEIINLGKSIIAELDMETECNTPARWLVHYIAENIHISEANEGDEKDKAQKKCVDAIIKLWHHRSELPEGINPFTEFDSVFRGLSRLDRSSERPYYNEFSQFDNKTDENESNETKQWVNTAISIDKAARTLVLDSFERASKSALTIKAKDVLSQVPSGSGSDIRIMLNFMPSQDSTSSKEAEEIQSKIQSIEALKSVCDIFIDKLNDDLKRV